LRITRQKVASQQRHEGRLKREAGRTHTESELMDFGQGFSLDELIGDVPTPDFIAALKEQHEQLAARLWDDTLRLIAARVLEGCTHEEIAQELGVTRRTIVRKVYLIQSVWEAQLRNPPQE
jgi:DNA-directed RNA polymerase specialized sigma24 family protein